MKENKKQKQNNTVILPIEERNPSSRAFYICAYIILTILAVVCLFPPLWVFLSAFKNINEFLATPPTIIPRSFEPWKVIEAWKQANFGRAYLNTLCIGGVQLIINLLFNGLAGYSLSRLKPKGWKLVFMIITWTMMMPHSMNMVPLYMTFIDMPIIHVNLSNTYIPLYIMAGAQTFNILLFKSFCDSIHMSYLEAARIDGCTEFGIFTKIILPLSKPIVFTISLFALNGIWGDFFWPYLLLRDESLLPTGVKIYKMATAARQDIYFMVMIFVMLPPIIIYFTLQKYMMKGLALGGIKG